MKKNCYRAFIGTNSVRGSRGIYTIEIDGDTGSAEIVSTTQAYNTGCVALSRDEKNLYAASEGMTFDGHASGGVTAYRVEKNGELTKLSGQRSYGQRTCCVAVDSAKEHVYGCDFYVGTWSSYPVDESGSLQPARLTVSPPGDSGWKALHCVAAIDDKFVAVISLAECALVIYRADDGSRVTSFPFPNGAFPRYLAVAEGTIYAMLQMPDNIFVLENHLEEDGTLRHIQTIGVMDEAHRTMPATSTIRVTPNQRLVLAANRPSNSVTVYSRGPGGRLTMRQVADIPGNGPRDFNISQDGKLVVVAMQHSDEVAIMKIDYENECLIQLGETIHVPSPAAVAVTGRNPA